MKKTFIRMDILAAVLCNLVLFSVHFPGATFLATASVFALTIGRWGVLFKMPFRGLIFSTMLGVVACVAWLLLAFATQPTLSMVMTLEFILAAGVAVVGGTFLATRYAQKHFFAFAH